MGVSDYGTVHATPRVDVEITLFAIQPCLGEAKEFPRDHRQESTIQGKHRTTRRTCARCPSAKAEATLVGCAPARRIFTRSQNFARRLSEPATSYGNGLRWLKACLPTSISDLPIALAASLAPTLALN